MALELNAHDYRLRIAPQHGATVLRAAWRHPDGSWVELLEPLTPGETLVGALLFFAHAFAANHAA